MPQTSPNTSKAGVQFLERHEGVVLSAYRDPVGIWTIGAGLTKASGVVVPKGGMRLSKEHASKLLTQALRRNYEPTVAKTMPTANQQEFDAAVSFHFNTGAIKRASWVKAWRHGDWLDVRSRIALWKKAGGRVLPGLVRRREEEFQLLRNGVYGEYREPAVAPDQARIVVKMTSSEIAEMRKGFKELGFDPGNMPNRVDIDMVRDFQGRHSLFVDGIIGRATLSTLQRMLDARRKGLNAGVVAAGGTAGGVALPAIDALPVDPSSIGLGGGLLWLMWTAWQYRDAVAGLFDQYHPDFAKYLREL